MLQNHLDQCIVTVRAKSPDGHLEALTEESDEDTDTVYSQEPTQNADSKRLSAALTSSTLTSSTEAPFEFPIETSWKPQHKVHFKEC
ncbi:unnamed protein product [Gongylonema pulchrum]|uniref:Uncharacterized protein n=1 Tax=Gongylonema pulchrum TaxID=637853 RepID=A0A183DBD8_9BILA|nr:unnamed protein product [Gongylonema pulchrum]